MRVLFAAILVGCGSSSAATSGPATGLATPHSAPATAPEPETAPASSVALPGPPSSPPPQPAAAADDAPSPSAVCAHVAAVMQKELAAAGAPSGGAPNDPECVKKAEGERAKDPKGYACDAKCIVAAKDFAAIQACSGTCK